MKGFASPPEIEVVDSYEIWERQPAGNWKRLKRSYKTRAEARAARREERELSDYTRSLERRIYKVRKTAQRWHVT